MGKSIENILKTCDFEAVWQNYKQSTSLDAKAVWVDIAQQIKKFDPEAAQGFTIIPETFTIKPTEVKISVDWSSYIDTQGIDLLDNAKQKVYLFRFYDSNKNFVCSKVGTTTRKVMKRLKEELCSPTYCKIDCQYAIIDRVYDCGNYPAEGLESYIRAEYIRLHPGAFKKNDRFMKILFDLEAIDTLVSNYNNIERG